MELGDIPSVLFRQHGVEIRVNIWVRLSGQYQSQYLGQFLVNFWKSIRLVFGFGSAADRLPAPVSRHISGPSLCANVRRGVERFGHSSQSVFDLSCGS